MFLQAINEIYAKRQIETEAGTIVSKIYTSTKLLFHQTQCFPLVKETYACSDISIKHV